ncbi:MAG: heparinase II/III-family protein [Kiritimatiellaeota bacterium]|nr:heparinase II/III-family protein [Kiritimatiellota bacterium]
MRILSCFTLAAFLAVVAANAQGTVQPEKVTREQVAEAMARAPKGHPCLFADGARFKVLRTELEGYELGRLAIERLCRGADEVLKQPPSTREMEGRRLLGVSRRVLHRTTTLAMAYRLTGNGEYLKRCVAEMDAVGAFEDWNPSHFLDVAEMTLAVAVAYDWLHGDLDEATRERVAGVILEKGLHAGQKQTGWVKAKNNWGQVCHAGMMAGALALREHHPDLAVDIVHRAIVNLPLSMRASFSPGGNYPEGPGYWGYGTDFNVLAIAMLQGVLGSDFGLAGIEGFAQTADYMDIVTGPSGLTFNYADCGGGGRDISSSTWWFARHLNRPDLLAYFERGAFEAYCKRRGGGYGNRLFAFFLPWLQPVPEGVAPKAPLNWSPGGIVPIVVLRSSWDDAKALFVGLKAGSPSGPHGHMDAGSFVFDAEGVRWAHDLGMEGYHGIESRGMNLWDSRQGSDRWKIFRLNNFSHNTLTIGNSLQKADGAAKVTTFKEGDGGAVAIIDLSGIYTNTSSVLRTVLFADGGLTLADTLNGLVPGTPVRWSMLTRAVPDEARVGSIILREKGKQLKLAATHDAKLEWKTEDVSAPQNEWDSKNPGMTRVFFEAVAPESGELMFCILFTPGGGE